MNLAPQANAAAPPTDTQRLRRVFSHFATGVAIVTGRDDQGRPIGMTVNSMASLSLQPPLLLWSIAKHSRNHAAFAGAGHFAVHVLHLGQTELSRRFHNRDTDRFSGLDMAIGRAGVPLLSEYLARFQCEAAQCIDAGDHSLLIGRVLETDEGEGEPLVFYRSRYTQLAPHAPCPRPPDQP